jgi:hypothetical protein
MMNSLVMYVRRNFAGETIIKQIDRYVQGYN